MRYLPCIALLAACGGGAEHIRVVDGSGHPTVEYDKVDGMKEGPVRFLRSDGSMRASGNYHNDRKSGDWITFSQGQDTVAKLHFIDGVKHGSQIYRASNGQLIRYERFDHGTPDGPLYMFFPDGKLKEETWYNNGVDTGRHLRWWRNDTLDGCALMGQYADGQNEGVWYVFYGNGHTSREGAYVRSAQNGRWRRWDRSGALILDQQFDHGKLVRTIVDRTPKH